MKFNHIFIGLAGVASLCLASCDSEDLILGDSHTQSVAVDCPAVEFSASNATKVEVDPVDPNFELTIVRRDSVEATYAIKVLENQDESFVVPQEVKFENGQKSAVIPVSIKADAEQGTALSLKLTFDDAVMNAYTNGIKTLELKATVIKWNSIGTCYWVGHIVNHFFGVESLPLAVATEMAETADAVMYRFDSPYAVLNTGVDEETGAYIGYPYNEPGDVTGNVEKFVITITKDGASLAPVNMGINYGYGAFSCGSIYGYLSTDIAKYPLGEFTESETGGFVTFPSNSLYVSMADYNDGGKSPIGDGESFFYLSKEDYFASLISDYKPVGYGFYDYAAFFEFGSDPDTKDYCYLELEQHKEDSTKYRISGWDQFGGKDFYFTVKNNIIDFEEQFSGYTHKTLGDLNVANFVETKSYYDYDQYEYVTDTLGLSYYDAEADAFVFNTLYSVEAGVVTIGKETFQMIEWYPEEEEGDGDGDGDGDQKAPAMRKRAAAKTLVPAKNAIFSKTFKTNVIAPRK